MGGGGAVTLAKKTGERGKGACEARGKASAPKKKEKKNGQRLGMSRPQAEAASREGSADEEEGDLEEQVQKYLLTGIKVLAYWYKRTGLPVQKYVLPGAKVLASWHKSTNTDI